MFSNFKTTLAGIGVGFLNLYANGMSPKQAALSLGIALLGSLTKDFNATGGTKAVSDEAAARVEKDKHLRAKF
jgi:hypothetical protein